jgi:hypothetical protein
MEIKINTIKLMTPVALLAAITLASSGVCKVGQTVATPGKESKSVVEEAKKNCITGGLGVALTNEYIYNGLVQDKDTLIAQPYLNLYFKLYEGEGFLNNITFNLPLWWSIHDINKPIGAGTTRAWYEFDWDPGFTFTFAKKYSLSISYFEYDSPGDYFNTSRNLNLTFNYDDTDLLGAFALHPHIVFQQELDGHSGSGYKGGSSQYYELGIAPSYTLEKGSTYPVTLTFPATVGLGSNGFYGQGFGFFSIGATASLPLAFIPSCYGSWSTSLSGLYYYLGTNASSSDTPSAPFTYSNQAGRRDQGVVAWTIGTSF